MSLLLYDLAQLPAKINPTATPSAKKSGWYLSDFNTDAKSQASLLELDELWSVQSEGEKRKCFRQWLAKENGWSRGRDYILQDYELKDCSVRFSHHMIYHIKRFHGLTTDSLRVISDSPAIQQTASTLGAIY